MAIMPSAIRSVRLLRLFTCRLVWADARLPYLYSICASLVSLFYRKTKGTSESIFLSLLDFLDFFSSLPGGFLFRSFV
jgi:hypothetical protein